MDSNEQQAKKREEPNIHLLNRAKHEIISLRRHNEILAAKVHVIDVFSAALLGVPQRGFTQDIVHEIEEEIKKLSEPA